MTKKAVNKRTLPGKTTESGLNNLVPRRPPVAVLLEADRRHRRKVRAKIRARELRDNPLNRTMATTFLLRAPEGKWRFIACHDGDAGRVAVYYRAPGQRSLRRRFVVTAESGTLSGKRVVRGRTAECRKLYRVGKRQTVTATLLNAAPYAVAPAAIALAMIPFANALTDIGDTEDRLQQVVTATLEVSEYGVQTADEPVATQTAALETPGVAVQKVAEPPSTQAQTVARLEPNDTPNQTAGAGVIDQPSPAATDERSHSGKTIPAAHGPGPELALPAAPSDASQRAEHTPEAKRGPMVRSAPLKPEALAAAAPVRPAARSSIDKHVSATETVSKKPKPRANSAPAARQPALVARADAPPLSVPRSSGSGYTNVWVETPSQSAADTLPALTLNATPRRAPGNEGDTFPLSLETAFDADRNSNPGIHFDPEQHDAYWQMNAKSLIAGKVKVSGQVAFSSFDPDDEGGFGDDQYRAMRLGLQSTQGAFGYGTKYRSAGKEFAKHKKDKSKFKQDREIWETWGSRRFGDVWLKTAFIQEENNLRGDPKKPRLRDQETRLTFSHLLSNWPSLGYSFSYGTGTRESSDEPAGYAAFRGPMERLGASLYYSSNNWNASLSSYQIAAEDDQRGGRGSTIRGHSLGGSYYPSKNSSISPWLGITDEYYESDQSHTEGQFLGLAVSQGFPHQRLRFNAYGSYYSERNLTWSYDTDGVYAEAGLVWSLNKKRARKPQSVGLHFTYSSYNDRVFSNSSTEDSAVWLVYKLNDGGLPFFRLDDFSPFR